MDATALKERTLSRNAGLWQNWDVAGIAVGLAGLEDLVNRVSRDMVRMPLAIIDEAAQFQAEQRDKLYQLDLEEVETHRFIAKEKYETQLQVLAYKVAGEEALLAAKRYDVAVQSFIMAAKEYAAEVEREQIALQRDRAQMDIQKEEAHLEEVKSKIQLEYVERAQVEVDIAKAKLQVAQANVRAVMAGIEAEEAELKVVQAELEVAMIQAEKATLIADIAHIFADIVVRGLAKIKLAVETAEIEAGFEFIQQKLDDLLAIWGDKIAIENLRASYEELYRQEVEEQTEAAKELEDLKKTQQRAETEVFFFEKDKVDGDNTIPEMRAGGRSQADRQEIHEALEGAGYKGAGQSITDCALEKQDNLFDKKVAMAWLKQHGDAEKEGVAQWAKLLINAAHRKISKYKEYFEYEKRTFSQRIHKGFFAVTAPGAPGGVVQTSQEPVVDLIDQDVAKAECQSQGYVDPENL
jgi:hypothetical protein